MCIKSLRQTQKNKSMNGFQSETEDLKFLNKRKNVIRRLTSVVVVLMKEGRSGNIYM